MRLAPARFGGGNPLQRQPELLLIVEMMVDARLVVGGERHDQRAFVAQFDVDAGRLQQFRGEGRPARLALAPERDQRILAGLGLAAGGQHPGGGMARAAAGRAAVEHLDATPRAASRQAMPSPITPAPMMATLGDVADTCRSVRQRGGSLRWHDPDRFDGCDLSRGSAAPQSVPFIIGHFRCGFTSREQRLIAASGPAVEQSSRAAGLFSRSQCPALRLVALGRRFGCRTRPASSSIRHGLATIDERGHDLPPWRARP